MGRVIDKGFCDEDDPIFTEGITVFSLRRHKPACRKKTPTDVCPDAGSALTLQAEDDPSLRKEKED
jgi:hypothetical protein